ncbi:MAG: hypothetical protein LAN84_17375 [Acidobacteriia bacterium]|nr:hypothetical protein [Terriglobia bacterium]
MATVPNPDTVSSAGPQGKLNGEITPELVREEMQRVLASREFRSSRRCQDFLRYVVENALQGHSEGLKERAIGIDVFGKPSSYDPSEDATVRVKAGEVRKRLSAYYHSGPSGTLAVIDLPLGSYAPEFRLPHEAPLPQPGREELPEAPRSLRRWRAYGLAGAAGLAACLALAMVWVHFRAPEPASELNKFWAPVFQERKPVSLCAAVVPVYSRMRQLAANQPARPEDFVLVPNQFVAAGDLNALLQVSETLARLHQPYRLRIGEAVSFRDLRSGPAVLVGYSYTRWQELSRGFRYFIDMDRLPIGILDNGQATDWTIATHPDDPTIKGDYAIVSRVFDPDTHNMLVEIAGITHYGTEAAGDFVSNATLMNEAFRAAPAGWQSKNVQVVLHVKIIGGSPSVPNVVATYFW